MMMWVNPASLMKAAEEDPGITLPSVLCKLSHCLWLKTPGSSGSGET